MCGFVLERAATLDDALKALAVPGAMAIAGGTEVLNWMKEDIVAPPRLVDINSLTELNHTAISATGLRLGALARMSDVANNEAIQREYPVIAQALSSSASPQLRNMASLGGNLLQRTRCPYFRADTELPCNKRRPGSGCSALQGEDRSSAIFARSDRCIATHPSDLAVALMALDASIEVHSTKGARSLKLTDLYSSPDSTSLAEATLQSGELILAITVPAAAWGRRSHYLKVRERASYEFALVSAAAAVEIRGTRIHTARLALGGVAHKPWRLVPAETALRGIELADTTALRRAVSRGFSDAHAGRQNEFKIELGIRASVRAIQVAAGVA